MGKSKDLTQLLHLTGMIRKEKRPVELCQGVFNASAHDNSRPAPAILTKEVNHEQQKDNE